jgi:hypothetical protein
MRLFGETAIVARHTNKKARSKFADHGITVIFISYSDQQEMDACKLLNIQTRSQHLPVMSFGRSRHIHKTWVSLKLNSQEVKK